MRMMRFPRFRAEVDTTAKGVKVGDGLVANAGLGVGGAECHRIGAFPPQPHRGIQIMNDTDTSTSGTYASPPNSPTKYNRRSKNKPRMLESSCDPQTVTNSP